MWKPMNSSQKWILPRPSSSILPVNLGHQKYMPAKKEKTIVPKST